MTRINSAISPKNLTDQHLIAELRELPRIFTAVNKRIEQGKEFNDIPEKFTLGTGHCKFFYNKLDFLQERFVYLCIEYEVRFQKIWNFQIENNLHFTLNKLKNYYSPTQEERELLIDRISTRITESKQVPRYYGQPITKERAIEILKGEWITDLFKDKSGSFTYLKSDVDKLATKDSPIDCESNKVLKFKIPKDREKGKIGEIHKIRGYHSNFTETPNGVINSYLLNEYLKS